MRLSQVLRSIVKFASAIERQARPVPPAPARPAVRGDGFDPSGRPAPVSLGLRPLEYVAQPGQVAGPGQVASPTASATDSFRKLIAADIKTAYGREATQGDYDYWLPKLMGGNDSGFVTSGQLSATEYWHRRLLGWQAGGSDMATQGPYAGSSDAHGPVPSASDVVPGVPQAGMAATTNAQRADAFRMLIAIDIKAASGRDATQEDFNYWLPKLMGPNDSGFVTSGQMTGTEYWHRRMLGWQAGGADVARFGPYAGTGEAHGPVPSAIEMLNRFAGQ